jgi:hypothetical protein
VATVSSTTPAKGTKAAVPVRIARSPAGFSGSVAVPTGVKVKVALPARAESR